MSLRSALSIVIVVIGAIAAQPGLILLGLLSLAVDGLSRLWSRRGLREVSYTRTLAVDRAVWGDRVPLDITIENGKLLPLAWLEARDFVTDGTFVEERRIETSDRPGYGVLRNFWTLGPFESVVRHFHVVAEHRGVSRFQSVVLSVADLFGRDVATREDRRPASLLVRPRTVPVRSGAAQLAPFGSRAARQGLIEDPALLAGVRPFQQGDPLRRVHQRATARVGHPVSKRFEPSTARQALIALDIQTHDGPHWLLSYDEDLVEGLIVAVVSIARRLIADGAACGVAANGWTYSRATFGFLAPRAGRDQLPRIADLLGRLSPTPSVPFSWLLSNLPSRLPAGSLVLTISSRDMVPFAPSLRRLRNSAFEVRHVGLGPLAPASVAHARQLGIHAVIARLEPNWKSTDALTLAS
jgi:uncharacterized protein (DUF58 family)